MNWDKATQDAILLTYLLVSSAVVYWIGLCLHKPEMIRVTGAHIGARLIALGYAVEDFKDTYSLKRKRLIVELKLK